MRRPRHGNAEHPAPAAPDPRWTDTIRGRAAAGVPADIALAPAIRAAATAAGLDPDAVASLIPNADLAEAETPDARPPTPFELGALFQIALDAGATHRWARKATGAIFTPQPLAAALVRRALRDRPTPRRVLDPAAGAGALLLATLDAVTATGDHRARRDWILERLHGVDSDLGTVRVCRAALWLAAADPDLEPTALDARIVHGDALLGTVGPRPDHPSGAFDRRAGDATHPGPHRAPGARDAALARFRAALAAARAGSRDAGRPAPDGRRLRDAWCALWFWPATALDELLDAHRRPLPPAALAAHPRVDALAARHAFLHWDLAFPAAADFDLIVANPPWDTDRPDARNFFLARDPAQRERSSAEARRARHALCLRDPTVEDAWLDHLEEHRQRRHWFAANSRLAGPGGDPNQACRFLDRGLDLLAPAGRLAMWLPAALHGDLGWSGVRRALLERHALRALIGFENRDRLMPGIDGRFKFDAVVVDRDGPTDAIEVAFLSRSLDALERPARRIRPAALTALSPRSLAIPELRCQREAEILERLHADAVPFDAADRGWRIAFRREFDLTRDCDRFVTRAAAEAAGHVVDRHDRWLPVAPGAIRAAPPPDADGWLVLRDGRAVPRDALCGEPLVPLHEGRMIDVHDDAAKCWVRGHGRGATWADTEPGATVLGPRVLVATSAWRAVDPTVARSKVGFMAIGSATNRRTVIASALWRAACGNSVPTLRVGLDTDVLQPELALAAVLGSLTYDFAVRARLSGLNLNRCTLAETPLPDPSRLLAIPRLRLLVATSTWRRPAHAAAWADFDERLPDGGVPHPDVGADPVRRRAIQATLDAVVAHAFGLGARDLAWLLRDCAAPAAALRRATRDRQRDPRGYWRIDRELPPTARRTVWAVAALVDLESRRAQHGDPARAVADFVRGRDGLGWTPPPALDPAALGFDALPGAAATGPAPAAPRAWPAAGRAALVAEMDAWP